GRRRRWDTRVGEISCRPRACGRVSALWKAPTRTCGWMPRSSAPGSGEACARRARVIAYAVHEWGVGEVIGLGGGEPETVAVLRSFVRAEGPRPATRRGDLPDLPLGLCRGGARATRGGHRASQRARTPGP